MKNQNCGLVAFTLAPWAVNICRIIWSARSRSPVSACSLRFVANSFLLKAALTNLIPHLYFSRGSGANCPFEGIFTFKPDASMRALASSRQWQA